MILCKEILSTFFRVEFKSYSKVIKQSELINYLKVNVMCKCRKINFPRVKNYLYKYI